MFSDLLRRVHSCPPQVNTLAIFVYVHGLTHSKHPDTQKQVHLEMGTDTDTLTRAADVAPWVWAPATSGQNTPLSS